MVDGAADLLSGTPPETMRVPINVTINGKDYEYPGTITKEDVLGRINDLKPGAVQTSQPSPKQILSALENAGENVLYISVSSKLSGTYNAATVAKNLLKKKGVNLHVFDSLSGSIGVGILAREAYRLREQGAPLEDVIPALVRLRESIYIYFAVPTLGYLVAGGRLDPFKAALARIVGVRPILGIKNGQIDLENTVRKNKIWAEMVALIESKSVILAYAPGEDNATTLEKYVGYRGVEIEERTLFSPAITAHLGPGAAGFAFVKGGA